MKFNEYPEATQIAQNDIFLKDGADGTKDTRIYTIDKTQLSLFQKKPWLLNNGERYWIRDIANDKTFPAVNDRGMAELYYPTVNNYVRPVFGLC